jgi:glycosyltransferase involved in cell wall biosynthesis
MKEYDLIILGWHQIYLSANAGGYVRLKEFLKRLPKDLHTILLDNKPTLFKEEMSSSHIVVYDTPQSIKGLRSKFFLFWLLLETISAGFVVYRTADKLIKEKKTKAVYVPVGEFPQLYLPGIMLKKKYPEIKLIVDILNFELPDKSAYKYFNKLRATGVGLFRAVTTIVVFYIGYFLMSRTLGYADYVFTVSPELVTSIKKVYKKETIGFTPSGVDSKRYSQSKTKKYAAMYVGRVNIHKGIQDLLDVWALVAAKKKDAVLCVAGYIDESIENHIRQEIKEKKLEKNIILHGQVSDNQKIKLLSESGIFLHLARYEPLFPVIGILEGMASGLYTVVYDMPVIASQIQKLRGETSLAIVKNGDIETVSKNILKQLSLPEKDKKAIAVNAERFAKKYDWDVIAKIEFDEIRRLINKK